MQGPRWTMGNSDFVWFETIEKLVMKIIVLGRQARLYGVANSYRSSMLLEAGDLPRGLSRVVTGTVIAMYPLNYQGLFTRVNLVGYAGWADNGQLRLRRMV